jgi:hypothetical protein
MCESPPGEPTGYNLIDEPWIPVLWCNGRFSRVGIREALIEAGRIRQIAASNPMDRVAVVRFLLALLYWCRGNPPPGAEGDFLESLPTGWFGRLDDNRDCFNLLGDGKRFYQYKGDHDKPLTANYLIHEIPTGNNFWHFAHSTDRRDGLCAACCALGLVRLPAFATSGGPGKSPGVNAKPPLYVVPLGDSLATTLAFSWRRVPALGTPAWEQPDQRLPGGGEVPLLLGLTWLPRRVWLASVDASPATCISCGQRARLVRTCEFAGTGSAKGDANGPPRVWRDPHVIYDVRNRSLAARDALGSTDAAAGQWATIVGGLLGTRDPAGVRGKLVVGFSTVKNDKYLEATEWLLPAARRAGDARQISKFERWQLEGKGLLHKLKPRGSALRHPEIRSMLDAVRPHVESLVSARVGELVVGGDKAWEEAASEYRVMMGMAAGSLSPGYTAGATARRLEIAAAGPDLRSKAAPAAKSRRRKGAKE